MRATAFFANAFTRDLEGLEDFGDIGLPPDCQEASVMAIRELTKFYEIEQNFEDVFKSYSELYDQHEWVEEDRKWAQRIAELAGFRHLANAAKQFQPVTEVVTS